MGTFYKGIEYVSNPREEVVYYKNQSFSSTAEGINSIQYRSESLDLHTQGNLSYTPSGSHYLFMKHFRFRRYII